MYIQVGLLTNIPVAKPYPLVVLFDSNTKKIPQGGMQIRDIRDTCLEIGGKRKNSSLVVF